VGPPTAPGESRRDPEGAGGSRLQKFGAIECPGGNLNLGEVCKHLVQGLHCATNFTDRRSAARSGFWAGFSPPIRLLFVVTATWRGLAERYEHQFSFKPH